MVAERALGTVPVTRKPALRPASGWQRPLAKDRPSSSGVAASWSNCWPSWVLSPRELDGRSQRGQRDPSRGDLVCLKQLQQGTGRLVLSARAPHRPHCGAEL